MAGWWLRTPPWVPTTASAWPWPWRPWKIPTWPTRPWSFKRAPATYRWQEALPEDALQVVDASTPTLRLRDGDLLVVSVEGVARAWVGLAECDPLVDEGIDYADKLRAAGVAVDLEIYRGVTHEFIKMGRAIPEARQAHADAAAALRRAFGLVLE